MEEEDFDADFAQEVLDNITDQYKNLKQEIKEMVENSTLNDIETLEFVEKNYGVEEFDIDSANVTFYYYENGFDTEYFVPGLELSASIEFTGGNIFNNTPDTVYNSYCGECSTCDNIPFYVAIYQVVLGMLLNNYRDKLKPYLKRRE
jgi:hypothetical protein